MKSRPSGRSPRQRALQGGLLAGTDLEARAVEIDTDRDGKISRVEFVAYLPERLKAADKDGNQTLVVRSNCAR